MKIATHYHQMYVRTYIHTYLHTLIRRKFPFIMVFMCIMYYTYIRVEIRDFHFKNGFMLIVQEKITYLDYIFYKFRIHCTYVFIIHTCWKIRDINEWIDVIHTMYIQYFSKFYAVSWMYVCIFARTYAYWRKSTP